MQENVLNNSLGNIDVGFSGIDLLKESEINIQNKT